MRAASHAEGLEGATHHPYTFEAAYETYRGRLYAYCLTVTRDPALAEDIVQDTFVRLFATRSQLDPDRSPWPLLLVIARRSCIDVQRRQAYSRSRFDEMAAAGNQVVESHESTVLHRMDFERLNRAIAQLPARQRAALELYALENWSYSEVADHLGDTVAGVKSMLQRARARLRLTCGRSFGAVLGAMRAWRDRPIAMLGRLHRMLPNWGGLAGTSAGDSLQAVAAAVVALSTVLAGATGTPPVAEPHRQVEEGSVAHPAPPTPTAPKRPSGSSAKPAVRDPIAYAEQEAASRQVHEGLERVVGPPSDMAPQDAHVTTMAVSPNYGDDHTIFASEQRGTHSSLFVSRDGGASWRRTRGLGFRGARRFLFPPTYAHDGRFFVLGSEGLQVGEDGGESFVTLVPHPWLTDGAISPTFGTTDTAILLVGKDGVWEFDYESRVLRRVRMDDGTMLSVEAVRYAADASGNPTLLVGGYRVSERTVDAPKTFFGRCSRRPDQPRLPGAGADVVAPPAAPTPVTLECRGSKLAYSPTLSFPDGATPSGLLLGAHGLDISVSDDGGRTFITTDRRQWPAPMNIVSVEVVPAFGPSSVVAVGTGAIPAMRSDDGGRSWSSLDIPLPGFEWGASAVTATPTGRLLVSGLGLGSGGPVACSEDGGRTWAYTCPTPETAT